MFIVSQIYPQGRWFIEAGESFNTCHESSTLKVSIKQISPSGHGWVFRNSSETFKIRIGPSIFEWAIQDCGWVIQDLDESFEIRKSHSRFRWVILDSDKSF